MGTSAQSARTAAGYDPLPVPPHAPLSAAPVPAPWDEHNPPASPSSRINLEHILCLASQEALQGGRYNLQLADDCPICHLAVGRHRFLPPAAVTALPASSPSTSSSRSSTELGKNVTLPRWKVDYHHAKPFLDRIERLLVADNVTKDAWPRLLLKAIPNVTESAWVKLHIVDPGIQIVDWATARDLFTTRFEIRTWTQQSQQLYELCRQASKESVQDYSDRFMNHVTELRYEDNDQHVILHFQLGLYPSIQTKIRDRVHLWRDMQKQFSPSAMIGSLSGSAPYEIKSLKEMIDLALNIERSAQVNSSMLGASGGSSPSPSPSTGGVSAPTPSPSSPKKSCVHHPKSTSHNTVDCKFPDSRASGKKPILATGSSPTGGLLNSEPGAAPSSAVKLNKQGIRVKCYTCGGNHYADDKSCPQRSDRFTRSAAAGAKASVSTPFSSPPARPLPTPSSGTPSSGSPSVPAPIRGNAITVTIPDATPSLSCGSVSLPSVHRSLTAAAVLPTQRTVYFVVNGRLYSTLVDSGAEVSFADFLLITSWAIAITPPVPGGKIRLAHADIFTDRSGSVELDATALFPCSDREAISFRCRFETMPIHGVGNEHHFIIGRDLIPVLFPEGIPLAYLPQQTSTSVIVAASYTLVDSLAVSSDASMLGSIPSDDQPDRIQLFTPEQLETEYAAPRQHLLQALSPLLAINSAVTGFCTVPEAVVCLEVNPADALRLWRRQYPIAETLRDAATVIIDRWFSEGKIVLAPPGCPYNNPITVAPKKDEHGKLTGARPCLDTRALNQVLISNDRFLIPHIRSLLDSFAGNSIFSEFDLQEAYLQFPLNPESQPLTAFTWNRQQYMFAGCLYGISLLTSFFQRIMTRIFGDLPFCSPYVDNLPFAACDWETHLQQATLIVERCNQVNLKIKPRFNLGHAQLKCLGHVLSVNGIAADPDKLAVVRDWPHPITGKQMQSFLGLCSFLRQHVRHYAELTAPLEDVKLEPTIQWNDLLRTAFDVKLRRPFCDRLCYRFPISLAHSTSQRMHLRQELVVSSSNLGLLMSTSRQPTSSHW